MSTLYLFMWLYEIGNWLSLSVTGVHATILSSGVIPVGAMGGSPEGTGFSIAKLLQVGICVGATLIACRAVSRKGLRFTSVTLTGVTGMYIASMYWEMFSLTSFVPMVLHEATYVVLSVALTFGLLRKIPVVPHSERLTKGL